MSEHNLVTANPVAKKESFDVHLRSVDLNLLTVFDAVMQEQNVTRAAQSLGMSQPAVSNAVARLKLMFDDELFFRSGRGIQPTIRAKQLFGRFVKHCNWCVMNCRVSVLNRKAANVCLTFLFVVHLMFA